MSQNNNLFAEERKEKIIELINENDKVYVPEMCDLFNVSPATIRNDLNDLEKAGRLKRTHGGAISITTFAAEPRADDKKAKNITRKEHIANNAINLINDGEIILIDTGTTTYQLAAIIHQRKNITVVTNDIEIAKEVENINGINIILLGGFLRKGFHCTVGHFNNIMLSEISVDKAFVAANGVDIGGGAYTPDIGQAENKKLMISSARNSYLLVDSSKFGRKSFIKFAEIDEFDAVITDNQIEEDELGELKKKVKVIL